MSFTELNIKIEKIICNSAFIKIKLILKMQILTVGYSADMQVNRIKNKCQEWSAGAGLIQESAGKIAGSK